MKIVINPKYSSLSSFIENIPTIFLNEGVTIYKARNELKCFTTDYNIVVKKYKKPHLFNRIAYSFFRPSKAKRAYEYALKLLALEVESPAPIAYIEQSSFGLFTIGYFISIYEKDYSDIRELMKGTKKDDVLLKELSLFIANIHNKGILHLDMSPGNILYKKSDSVYHFSLIDINRMKFLPSISVEKRYKSFKRLSDNQLVLTAIAKLYAKASNLNETETVEQITRYNTEFFLNRES